MRYEDVNKAIIAEFPAFSVDEDDFDLQYVVAGCFSKYIFEAYRIGDNDIYNRGLQFIEKLHSDDNPMVQELATIGYLESIQNTWPQDLLASNIPYTDLGDLSKIWWTKLNDFWKGDLTALRNDDPVV